MLISAGFRVNAVHCSVQDASQPSHDRWYLSDEWLSTHTVMLKSMGSRVAGHGLSRCECCIILTVLVEDWLSEERERLDGAFEVERQLIYRSVRMTDDGYITAFVNTLSSFDCANRGVLWGYIHFCKQSSLLLVRNVTLPQYMEQGLTVPCIRRRHKTREPQWREPRGEVRK